MRFFHKFVCVFVCVFLSYICMRVCMHDFVIHFYVYKKRFAQISKMPSSCPCFHPFPPPPSAEQTTNAVPAVMTPPQKHFYSHVFFIHLYACLYLGRPWRSGECGRPITRGLAVQSPLTAQRKDWWADSWRCGSSPPCHG